MTYTAEEWAAVIDHTNLHPDATSADLEGLADDALEYGFGAVCVYDGDVEYVNHLVGDKVAVCSVIGFPHGRSSSRAKADAAYRAMKAGADEIDMVINQGYIKEGRVEEAVDDIRQVRESLSAEDYEPVLKVIVENCNLTDEEKVWAYEAAHDAGADFIKTSTGFGTYGARVEDVELMADTVDRLNSDMGIKVSGGIKTFQDAQSLFEASRKPLTPDEFRIGASAGIGILDGYDDKI